MLRLLMSPRQSKPFIALFPDSLSSRSNPEFATRLFAPALTMDILQTPVEIWLTGEAFFSQRHIGI
jgi:hypothetical protein